MTLAAFDPIGDAEVDDDGEEIVPSEVRGASLVRYVGEREHYLHPRLNPALWRAASALPVVLVKPVPAPGDVLANGHLLTVGGSVANFGLLEVIGELLEAAGRPASQLAHVHGGGRRDLYFAAESIERFEAVLKEAGERSSMAVGFDVLDFTEAGTFFLPVEWIGRLGLAPRPPARKTRFGFSGEQASLVRLRAGLEALGYRFDSSSRTRELRVTKTVPLDGKGFLAELRRIVPLSRELRCAWLGEEAVDPNVFRVDAPVPEHYYPPKRSFFGRLFGREPIDE